MSSVTSGFGQRKKFVLLTDCRMHSSAHVRIYGRLRMLVCLRVAFAVCNEM